LAYDKEEIMSKKPTDYENLFAVVDLATVRGPELFLDKKYLKSIPKQEKELRKAIKKFIKAHKTASKSLLQLLEKDEFIVAAQNNAWHSHGHQENGYGDSYAEFVQAARKRFGKNPELP
jgi:hypothetical protein